ncbi:eukaryotic membrane protein family-domain-containing protein [Halteromyces radiatus]|uniref:eukaryotic membrane protein family-domain-containing protein n=1 Tax=Halteromyces radiatus TaxID=101107 RepID=UPI00221EA89E|nr:eukaryotic membrane protein family-domain-containing protein [Halteromyces radiatus]KAI8089470.1 eukaryotic membrane protein family-domain-containing protein [Halteromyces radiatus]
MNYEKIKSTKPVRSSSVPSTLIQSPNSFQLLDSSPTRPSSHSKKKKRQQHQSRKSQGTPHSSSLWDHSTDQTVPNNSSVPSSPTIDYTDHHTPSPLQQHFYTQSNNPTKSSLPDPLSSPPLSPLIQDSTSTTRINWTSLSFWDYLRDELTVADFDTTQEIKRERVTNFLAVPGSLEKLMGFGYVVCLDSFLYTFTILPLRFALAFYHYLLYIYANIKILTTQNGGRYMRLRPSQKCDLLKGLLIVITCVMMSYLDPSRLYHSIRGQAVLKLYVVLNVLEVCDKLCCSVGVDILDALFSKSTLGSNPSPDIGTGVGSATSYAKRQLKPITLFFMACGYMLIHTSVLFFQMITLNVAINFYSNALLTLLISNQFVEIKQSVFKKFERENLFQLSCSDIVERFQQSAYLVIITLRNVIELSDSSPSSILPSTFVPLFKLPATTSLNTLMTPVVMVIASELMVDWIKHAFITKFNQIRPSIYSKYIDVLCKDLVVGSPGRLTAGKKNAFIDQSPVVSRRIGFPSLPLACMAIRMMQQLLPMIFMSSHHGGDDTSNGNAPSSVASMVTNGLLNYLMDHQGTVSRLLPARIQLVVLSMVRCGWLERGLDKTVRILTWTLLVFIIAIILLALKVLVGMNLLGYAYKRYTSMEEREKLDEQKEKEMREMNQPETEYQQQLKKYVNDPTDNVMGKAPIKYTLENVDRFSMVRSRIP